MCYSAAFKFMSFPTSFIASLWLECDMGLLDRPGSTKGCVFPAPLLRAGRKGVGKGKLEPWSHCFPLQGNEGRSRQSKAIPSRPIQPPGHEAGSTGCPWWTTSFLPIPPFAWGAGMRGLGMLPAARAQLGLCLPDWEPAPFMPSNKAEWQPCAAAKAQVVQVMGVSKGTVRETICCSKSVPMSLIKECMKNISPLFLMWITKRYV